MSAGRAPAHSLPDEGDWKWAGWRWDSRSMHWHPSWRNVVLGATAIEGSGHWSVIGRANACGHGDTFSAAWREMVASEPSAELRKSRRARRALPKPWAELLSEWTPEKRTYGIFSEDASGSPVHHDDPLATRWCLAGWIAHKCMREGGSWSHGVRAPEWWELSDDTAALREIEFMWQRIPPMHRDFTLRVWKERVPRSDRKRLDQHPLGYWWFIAPTLATKFLGIPS